SGSSPEVDVPRRRPSAVASSRASLACHALAAVPQHDLVRTHGGEEPAEAQRQAVLDQRVVDPVRVAPLAYEPCRLQHPEMPGARRSADRKALGDLSRRTLTRAQVLQDLPAGGISQRPEDAALLSHAEIGHIAL